GHSASPDDAPLVSEIDRWRHRARVLTPLARQLSWRSYRDVVTALRRVEQDPLLLSPAPAGYERSTDDEFGSDGEEGGPVPCITGGGRSGCGKKLGRGPTAAAVRRARAAAAPG
ncbi:unnamed protein product, partial [Phaeothamnion confervicola]